MIALDAIKRFLGEAGAAAPAEAADLGAGEIATREARLDRNGRLPPMNADGAARGARVLVFDSGLGGLTVLAAIAGRGPTPSWSTPPTTRSFLMARSARRRWSRASAR